MNRKEPKSSSTTPRAHETQPLVDDFNSELLRLGTARGPLAAASAKCPSPAFKVLAGQIENNPLAAFTLPDQGRPVTRYLREQAAAWDAVEVARAGSQLSCAEIPRTPSKADRRSWEAALTKVIGLPFHISPAAELVDESHRPIIARLEIVDSGLSIGAGRKVVLSDSIFASGNRGAAIVLAAGAVGAISAQMEQPNPLDYLRHKVLAMILWNEPGSRYAKDMLAIEHLESTARIYQECIDRIAAIEAVPAYPREILANEVHSKGGKNGADSALLQFCGIVEERYKSRECRPGVGVYSVLSRVAAELIELQAPRHVIFAALAMELSPTEISDLKKLSGPFRNDSDTAKGIDLALACRRLNLRRFNPSLTGDSSLPDYTLQYSWDRLVQSVDRIASETRTDPLDLLTLWGARKLENMRSAIDSRDCEALARNYDEIRFFAAPAFQRIGESTLSSKLLDTWSIAFPDKDQSIEAQKASLLGMDRAERAAFASDKLERVRQVLLDEFGLEEGSFTLRFREKPNYSAYEKSVDTGEQRQKKVKPSFGGDISNQTDLLSLELALADSIPKKKFEEIKQNIHERAGLGSLVGLPNDRGKWMRECLRSSGERQFFYELQVGTAEHFRQAKFGAGAPRRAEEKHLHMKVKRAYDNRLREALGPVGGRDLAGAAFNHSDPEMAADCRKNFRLLADSLGERYVHVQLLEESRHGTLLGGGPGLLELRFPRGSTSADLLIRMHGQDFGRYRAVRLLQKSSATGERPIGLLDELQPGQVFKIESERRAVRPEWDAELEAAANKVESVRGKLTVLEARGVLMSSYADQGQLDLAQQFGEQTSWLTDNIYRPLQARSHLESLQDFYAAVGMKFISLEDIQKYHDDRFAKVEVVSTASQSLTDIRRGKTSSGASGEMLSISISSNGGPIVHEIMSRLSLFKLAPLQAIVTEGDNPGSKQVTLELSAVGTEDRDQLAQRTLLLHENLLRDIKRERIEGPSILSFHRRKVGALIDMRHQGSLARVVGRLNELGAEVSELKLSSEVDHVLGERLYSDLSIEVLGPGRSDNLASEKNRIEVTQKIEQELMSLVEEGVIFTVEVSDISTRQLRPKLDTKLED